MNEESEPLGLRERKKAEVKRAIRDAALRLFAKHGYDAVNVDQIVAAANVSRTTFFNYFPSKKSVVFDADPAEKERVRAQRAAIPTSASLWEAIRQAVLGSTTYSERWLRAAKEITSTAPGLAPAFQDGSREHVDELWSWLEARTPKTRRAAARLQMNIAVAAVMSAFDEWDGKAPYATFLIKAAAYVDQLAPAFADATPADAKPKAPKRRG